MVRPKTPRSDPNPTDLGGLITPSSSAPSQPILTNQLCRQQTRAPTFHNIQIPPQADQQQNASHASLSSTSANDQAQPSNNNMVRKPRRRSRVSRRRPTTLLTTDTTNFRAMVEEFTGIPAPPFTSSPFPRSRLDVFGTSSSLRSSGPTGLDPSPPHLLRPFAQKVQPLPFVSSTSSTTSMIDVLGSNPTTNAPNSTYQHHNLLNMCMQSSILNFQPILQAQPKFSLSNSPNIHNLGSKPQGGSLEIPSNDHSHLKMGTSVLEELGLIQQQQQHPLHNQQQFLIMDSASGVSKSNPSKSEPNREDGSLATASAVPILSRDSPELLKCQDWNTFLRYLGNQKPPITLAECGENQVLGFLKYLDQFGKVKVHYPGCPLFGHPNPVAPCACPLWQASGSLDALIERLRSAYVEHGGRPESNPFAAGAVWDYLSEVRESQAKARGNTTGTVSDGDGSGSDAQTTFTLPTRRNESV